MKKRLQKFIITFLSSLLAFTLVLCSFSFAFDPQNMYRWNEKGTRFFNTRFSAAGSVRNYDYDLIIIGSSMVQNFKAENVAEYFGCRPLKVTLGGMAANETLFAYNSAQKAGKAKTYIVNIDLHRIASAESICEDSGRFPDYMFDYRGIKKFKYLLGYETWFKFIPTDIVLSMASSAENIIPDSYKDKIDEGTDINTMCEWDNTVIPGREKLLENYHNNIKNFDEGDNSVFSENAVKNAEDIMNGFIKTLDDDEELIIYLPAYSVLYWSGKDNKQFETLIEMREKIVSIACKHENIKVLDFQGSEKINNLDLYFDENHYGKELCGYIESRLNSDEFTATKESVKKSSDFIRESRKNYM